MAAPAPTTPVPVLPIETNTITRCSRVCVNCRVSMSYGLLVVQANEKKKRVSSKLGRVIQYIPERKQKVVCDEDGYQTEEFGKSFKLIEGHPSSNVTPSTAPVTTPVPSPVIAPMIAPNNGKIAAK